MKKEKLIELIKLAAIKHKQEKYPETLKLLQPVYGKIKLEKIDKLYQSAKQKTIEKLKILMHQGNYTEIKAIIDSYLQNIDDKEIKNIEVLIKRNLESESLPNNFSDNKTNTTPIVVEKKIIIQKESEINLTTETKNTTVASEFNFDDISDETKSNDFLIDSSDFSENVEEVETDISTKNNNLEIITKEVKEKIDISMLEHTPAEMLGETDIFFSENAFLGKDSSVIEEEDSFDLELESGFVQQAELSNDTTQIEEENEENIEEDENTDINFLIKQGVSLYEIGDLENALNTWRKALALEPNNPILKDYIANCKRELVDVTEIEKQETTSTHKSINLPAEEKKHFSKEELNRIIAIARTGEIDRAKQLLLTMEINEKNEKEINEASFYIKKLEEEFFIDKSLAKAEEFIDEKQSEKAIKILKSLLDKFPENEKGDRLLKLAQKRAEFDLINSTEKTIELQIEQPPVDRQRQMSIKEAKHAPSVIQKPKKIQLPIKTIIISIFVIIFIVISFLGYNFISSKQDAKKIFNNLMNKIVTSHNKKMAEMPELKKDKDKELKKIFTSITKNARLKYNNGKYLFSYYLYIQAESYGKLSENDMSYFQATKERMNSNINNNQILKRADIKIKKRQYEEAINDFYQLLSTNPENIKYKKQLLNCYLQTGISYGLKGECQTAKSFFDNAIILEPSDPYLPKHIETTERCINGMISKNQVKSWFLFFR